MRGYTAQVVRRHYDDWGGTTYAMTINFESSHRAGSKANLEDAMKMLKRLTAKSDLRGLEIDYVYLSEKG